MPSRAATSDDAEAITRTITLAFADDPVWGPALRRMDNRATLDLASYWGCFVESAIRHGTARMAVDGAAVSIWYPPREPELPPDLEARLHAIVERDLDERAREALWALFDRFEASRRPQADHYYLSLLATHPEHRGRGRGQILLAEDLERWDAAAASAYLESTNPANDHRYARAGFVPIGSFSAVRDDAPVTAMWRAVGALPYG
jgi:GNAT superfamily N-acetyltransferase